jgi:uncharacterized lipoprotein NlpE involved in copper resistance
MKKYVAMVLISSLVIMLLQQVALTVVSADAPQPPIYPSKDKFYDGNMVLNGDSGFNYVGYDAAYGEHSTYLHYSLSGINANKTLESVKLVIPILNGHVSRSQSTVDPYINVYGSSDDNWNEAGTSFNDLPAYNAANDFLGKKSFDFVSSSSGLLLNYDVTAFIKDQLAVADRQASFALTGPTAGDALPGATGIVQNIIMLNERESGNIGVPYLEYVYMANEPPTGTIAINNGDLYTKNTSVMLSLTFSDPESDVVEAQFSNDNVVWSAKAPVSAAQSWFLSAGDGIKTVYMKLSDQAGNTSTFSDTIILDATAPVIGGVSHLQKTNQSVILTITDVNLQSSTLNGGSIGSGPLLVSAAGDYSVVATDKAGNSTTVSFSIDKTAPTISGITNGSFYKQNVVATFSDSNPSAVLSATLNGSPYTSGSTITADGFYTLIVNDGYGNVTNLTFTIDKTAPSGSLSIENGKSAINRKAVALTITSSDANAVQMRFSNDGTDWSEADWMAAVASKSWSLTDGDGEKTVYMQLKDAAGNTAEFTDTIALDTLLPAITGVTDGDKLNQAAAITFNKGTATLNGSAFTSGSSVSAEGDYTLVVTDAAGNVATVSFSIDKTVPTVSGVTDGAFYKTDVQPTFSDNHTGVSAKLNGNSYTSGSSISAEGAYSLVVTDAYGNQVTVTFTIDKTPPLGSLIIASGAAGTGSTSVTLAITGTDALGLTMAFSNDNNTWSSAEALASTKAWTLSSGDGIKTVYVKLTDEAGNAAVFSDTIVLDTMAPIVTGIANGDLVSTNVTLTFNKGTATLNGNAFASGSVISAEGTYVLVVTDALGHVTTVAFTIDKAAPIVTGVSHGDKLNQTAAISFNEGTATLNGSAFTSGSSVSAEGDYTLVVTDAAGNVTTVSFSIDKTLPAVSGVTDGAFYKANVQPAFSDNRTGVSAKLNGNNYSSGSSITAEGIYSLVVTDAYGNQVTVAFTIDKTPPSGSIMINNGDAETTHGLVTLTINSTDTNEVTKQLSNDGTVWKAVSLVDWALSGGYGEKKVYLELVDAAGNKTIVSDTIIYRSVPVLRESSVNGSEDTELYFSGNDFLYNNADGTVLDEITIDTLPANGKLQLNGSDVAANDKITAASLAKLTFLPALNWFGQTSFEWSGSAQAIQAEHSAKVLITVAAVNDAPTVANATYSTTGSAKIEGQLTAADVDGDSITFAVVGQPARGKLTLDAATGKFSFEPEAGYYEHVTFTYKANDGKEDSSTATVTIVNNPPASSGSGSGSGGSTTPLVTIEGAGNLPGVKVEIVLKDGKQVLVVSLDGKQLTELIKNVKDNELTIDVGAASQNVELAVDAELIKQLNESGKTIKLVQGGTGYGLSSSAIRDVLTDWTDAGAQLRIEIKKADEADGEKIEKLAKDKGYSLLVTPMSYQLYFQKGDIRTNLSSVKGYITISYGQEELKGKQPKTAVLLLPNGKLVHVPTKISNNAGKFEIKVHSFANGIFTLIDYKKTFEDVGGWSKPYIEELAGRLIIQGTGDETFEPNRSVTRAEFSAIITGALGLYKENGAKTFSDVSEESWYASSLAAATEYGLISGYADGSFRLNEKISREEAMVILARSFSLMELKPGFTQAELDQGLDSFGDKDELKGWSQESVRLTVLLGIVNGSNNQLLPAEPMTREQLAAVIVKLLQAGQFI